MHSLAGMWRLGVRLAAMLALVAVQGGQGLLRMMIPWQASPYTVLVLEGPAEALADKPVYSLLRMTLITPAIASEP